jgi:hypothetical protein
MNDVIKTACYIPTVRAFETGTKSNGMHQATFWCSHCHCWHWHGVSDKARQWPGEHRVAHCWLPLSPFEAQGYHVWIVAKLPSWAHDRSGHFKERLTRVEVLKLDVVAKEVGDGLRNVQKRRQVA